MTDSTQVENAAKALLSAGIMNQRLREAAELILKTNWSTGDHVSVSWTTFAKFKEALALPKTQAENDAELLLSLLGAATLEKTLEDKGADQADIDAARRMTRTKILACQEAGLE